MENLKYSMLLGFSIIFVFGFICLLVGDSIAVKESENVSKNKVARRISGFGGLVVFLSIDGVLIYIFQGFTAIPFLGHFLLDYLLFPFISIIWVLSLIFLDGHHSSNRVNKGLSVDN